MPKPEYLTDGGLKDSLGPEHNTPLAETPPPGFAMLIASIPPSLKTRQLIPQLSEGVWQVSRQTAVTYPHSGR
ncbi:MAG: hypothetical protein NZM35_08155 [Chitinophagales bacterium]|nr:hypothetical protein [Chitinophagales bacterium]